MTINVPASTARQWFFVASDCTLDAPAIIKMDYKITSTGAVDCQLRSTASGWSSWSFGVGVASGVVALLLATGIGVLVRHRRRHGNSDMVELSSSY
jgi:hypothetical protein